ncbi:unnamed protein product [Prorocentrum cordatum]|uniref:Secreted protein n=1 Tax=Prorocentrum cordatum TaxID=2364126 RepID=A0ABN9SB49_9DINO|nr:unnamed protein product [Polarella glacialis]
MALSLRRRVVVIIVIVYALVQVLSLTYVLPTANIATNHRDSIYHRTPWLLIRPARLRSSGSLSLSRIRSSTWTWNHCMNAVRGLRPRLPHCDANPTDSARSCLGTSWTTLPPQTAARHAQVAMRALRLETSGRQFQSCPA